MVTPLQHIFIILTLPLFSSGQNYVVDSLRNPNHQSYLSDIDTKTIAKWIIADSIRPSDAHFTFRVMDSLNTVDSKDRQYYLKAFLSIMKVADGALAEAIGAPAMEYVEKHTKEFFELNPPLTVEQFESWASNVGFEIYLDSNGGKDTTKQVFLKKVKENCQDCSAKTLEKLVEFEKLTIKTINANKE